MSHKRKGQLTVSGEWARHLRPLLRRAFWKGERQAEKQLVRVEQQSTGAAASKAKPTSGSVEELLAAIAAHPHNTSEFDLWVPQALTLRGELVPMDVAMAVLLDKALEQGFLPAGFTPESAGRLYRYRRE